MAKVMVKVTLGANNPTEVIIDVPKDKNGTVLSTAVEKAVKMKFSKDNLREWTFVKHVG